MWMSISEYHLERGFHYRISTWLLTGTGEKMGEKVKMVEIWTEITNKELIHHAAIGLSIHYYHTLQSILQFFR